MAGYDLIDAYLEELAASMRWHRDVTDVVAESADHLGCAVERRIRDGLDPQAAQREVLDSFGAPAVVARSFSLTRGGKLALPTRSTRDAGVLAFVSAGMWMLLPVVWFGGGSLYDRLGDGGPDDEIGNASQVALMGLIALTLLGAASLLVVTMLTLRERHGEFGVLGTLGMVVTGFGTMAALIGWFFIGWGSILIVGTGLVATELWRQDLAPKAAVLATGTGLAIGGLAWGVLRFLQVGTADRFGEYQVANVVGLTTGPLILAAGLLGLGRWLTSEEIVELPDLAELAPA